MGATSFFNQLQRRPQQMCRPIRPGGFETEGRKGGTLLESLHRQIFATSKVKFANPCIGGAHLEDLNPRWLALCVNSLLLDRVRSGHSVEPLSPRYARA
jgi:hypothetical protein